MVSSSRILQGHTTSNDIKSYALIVVILVVFILLFFSDCVYRALRIWLCKCLCGRDLRLTATAPNEVNADNTVLMHNGRALHLTGDQRLAVLEVIFSDTSKER